MTSAMKRLLHKVTRNLGFEITRSSRSESIAQLTGVRNVLNHPHADRRNAMESLGHISFAVQLEWFLDLFQIDYVLDVGANNGQFAAELRRLGYRGTIVSFEPMAACVETLRQLSARDGAWSVFPYALGSAHAEQQLAHFADSTFSSLHALAPQAASEFGPLVTQTGSELIEIRTLDEIWSEALGTHAPRNILLKTDTQGHDLEVLRGARERLTQCAAVVCEASFAPIYADSPDYHALFSHLEANGFECAGINALCYRKDRPSLIEANSIFINAKRLREDGISGNRSGVGS